MAGDRGGKRVKNRRRAEGGGSAGRADGRDEK